MSDSANFHMTCPAFPLFTACDCALRARGRQSKFFPVHAQLPLDVTSDTSGQWNEHSSTGGRP
jgi:hypothetical protein